MGGKPSRKTPKDMRLKRNNPSAGIPLAKRTTAGTGEQRPSGNGSIANPVGSTINVRQGNTGRPK